MSHALDGAASREHVRGRPLGGRAEAAHAHGVVHPAHAPILAHLEADKVSVLLREQLAVAALGLDAQLAARRVPPCEQRAIAPNRGAVIGLDLRRSAVVVARHAACDGRDVAQRLDSPRLGRPAHLHAAVGAPVEHLAPDCERQRGGVRAGDLLDRLAERELEQRRPTAVVVEARARVMPPREQHHVGLPVRIGCDLGPRAADERHRANQVERQVREHRRKQVRLVRERTETGESLFHGGRLLLRLSPIRAHVARRGGRVEQLQLEAVVECAPAARTTRARRTLTSDDR